MLLLGCACAIENPERRVDDCGAAPHRYADGSSLLPPIPEHRRERQPLAVP